VRDDAPMSQVGKVFTPVPQRLHNVRFSGGSKPLESAAVKKAIALGEAQLNGSGRLVIRPSGTEPVIRVMAEADDPALIDSVIAHISDAIEAAA
jgi:phosphoglucosamine mutase